MSAHVVLGLGALAGLLVGPWFFRQRGRVTAAREQNP